MARKKIKVPGGILLVADSKGSGLLAVESAPPPPFVSIPLQQHRGRPACPCVSVKDYVAMGQIIGTAQGAFSAPVHASVSGTVTAIERFPFSPDPESLCITIENNGRDEFSSPIPYDKPIGELGPPELLQKIALSGIVDHDGFPLHDLLAEARKNRVETLILNGLITEPYLRAEESLMIGNTEAILSGAAISLTITGGIRCLVVINEKRSDITAAFAPLLRNERFRNFSLVPVKPRYPHHHARLLAHDISRIEFASDDPVSKTRCAVVSIEAAAALHDALVELRPFYERVVTVAGTAVVSPKNIRARIGAPVKSLLDQCSTDPACMQKLVAGGPLSGSALQDVSSPVVKSTNALLAFASVFPTLFHDPCIRCRRCMSVCPVRLEPSRLIASIHNREIRAARERRLDECIECGCCSYACPSRIDLVHWLRFGKILLDSADQRNARHRKAAA
jgi:Na+-translocating ferredoxin:NAD+ oxidoreductase subunit C